MKQNCGSALIAHVTYVRVIFRTQAIVFHAVSFSPAFSPILDTGLNSVSVNYQLQSLSLSQSLHACVNIWRGYSVSRIVLADIYCKLF